MNTKQNKSIPFDITPAAALQELREGNFRFINSLQRDKDLLKMVNETKDGQWPFAAILSCMDSRTSAELIFDQGLGDIFSVRIAGNVIMEDILGSLEYAVAVAGSKLIVVLGHSNCGAIKGACDNVQLGNLTRLINRIRPAIEQETTVTENRNSTNALFVEAVADLNTKHSAKEIIRCSPVIAKLVAEGTVGIVSAMYDVTTGKVSFHDSVLKNQPTVIQYNNSEEAA